MKLFEVRKEFKTKLKSHGIEVSDADFIIAKVLGVAVTELALINEISNKQYKDITNKIELRLKHIPVDRIFGYTYFYGRKFIVNKWVLSPRQDSEILVKASLDIIKANKFKSVLDLCTGSGCLAITINKETGVGVVATDISSKAIKVAKQNAKLNNADIKFIKSDLFNKVKQKFDIIISNPPYIETETINSLEDEVKLFDPKISLDGGADGLDFYKAIANEAKNFLNKGGFIVLEIGYNQKQTVKKVFKDYKFIDCLKDLNGLDRVLIFRSKL